MGDLKKSDLKEALEKILYTSFYAIASYGIEEQNFVNSSGETQATEYQVAIKSAEDRATDMAKTAATDMAMAIETFVKSGKVTSTIMSMAIDTAGTAAAQKGPVAPLKITGEIT